MLFKLYPLVIIVQLFCLYHAYTNKSDQKWFWIIFLFPMVGSLFYLYNHFYSRNNFEKLKEEVKGSFIQNYSLDKLEQKVKFSDTFANKIELANEHLNYGNYDRATEILESCNKGTHQDDVHLKMKLLQSYYLKESYDNVLEIGKTLIGQKEFANSAQKVAYAWSSFHFGLVDNAEVIFNSMDMKFSNYENRLEYAYFLQDAKGNEEAKSKIDELLDEINTMDSYEKRLNKKVIQEITQFYKQL